MKRAAERHGGTIEIESREGIGTTISVVLPNLMPEAARRAETVDQPAL